MGQEFSLSARVGADLSDYTREMARGPVVARQFSASVTREVQRAVFTPKVDTAAFGTAGTRAGNALADGVRQSATRAATQTRAVAEKLAPSTTLMAQKGREGGLALIGGLSQGIGRGGTDAASVLLTSMTATFQRQAVQAREALLNGLISPTEYKRKGDEAARVFNEGLARGLRTLGGQGQLTRAQREQIVSEYKDAGRAASEAFGDSLSSGMKSAGTRISGVGRGMTMGLTAPLVALAGASIAASESVDDAMDTIRIGTDATGAALEGLRASFTTLFSTIPASAGEVATAIADLNTRTGLTGEGLERMAAQTLTLARITKSDLGTTIRTNTRLFGDWGVGIDQQAAKLDYLFRVSQATGIGVNELTQRVVQSGAPMRQLGFTFEQTAALFGKFEKEGVNTELVLGRLSAGLAKFAEDGRDAPSAFRSLVAAIRAAKTDTEGINLAASLFGARGAADFAAAVREGRLEIDDFVSTINGSSETVMSAAGATDGFAERLRLLRNNAQQAVVPLGEALVDALIEAQPAIIDTVGVVTDLIRSFSDLSPTTQRAILTIGGISAATGPALVGIGGMISGIGSLAGGLLTASGRVGTMSTAVRGLGLLLTPGGAVIAGLAGMVLWLTRTSEEAKSAQEAIDNMRGAAPQMSANQINANIVASQENLTRLYKERDELLDRMDRKRALSRSGLDSQADLTEMNRIKQQIRAQNEMFQSLDAARKKLAQAPTIVVTAPPVVEKPDPIVQDWVVEPDKKALQKAQEEVQKLRERMADLLFEANQPSEMDQLARRLGAMEVDFRKAAVAAGLGTQALAEYRAGLQQLYALAASDQMSKLAPKLNLNEYLKYTDPKNYKLRPKLGPMTRALDQQGVAEQMREIRLSNIAATRAAQGFRVELETIVTGGRGLLQIAQGFDGINKSALRAADGLLSMLGAVSQLRDSMKTVDSAGSAIGLAGALATPTGIGAAIGIVGGIVSIIDGLSSSSDQARAAARQMEEAQREWARSLGEFARVATDAGHQLTSAIRDARRQYEDLARTAPSGNATPSALPTSDAILRAADHYATQYGIVIAGLYQQAANLRTLEAAYVANIRRLTTDLVADLDDQVLRLTGRSDEADVARINREYTKTVDALREAYGRGALTFEQYSHAVNQATQIQLSQTEALRKATESLWRLDTALSSMLEFTSLRANVFDLPDDAGQQFRNYMESVRASMPDFAGMFGDLDLSTRDSVEQAKAILRDLFTGYELDPQAFLARYGIADRRIADMLFGHADRIFDEAAKPFDPATVAVDRFTAAVTEATRAQWGQVAGFRRNYNAYLSTAGTPSPSPYMPVTGTTGGSVKGTVVQQSSVTYQLAAGAIVIEGASLSGDELVTKVEGALKNRVRADKGAGAASRFSLTGSVS